MPKHYCDYCDVFLTHDSASVRKAHNNGRNHLANVRDYYASLGHDKAQSIIDQITSSYESGVPPAGGFGFGPQHLQSNMPGGFGGAPPFPGAGAPPRPPFPPGPFPPGMMGPPFAPSGMPPPPGGFPGGPPPFMPGGPPFPPGGNFPPPGGPGLMGGPPGGNFGPGPMGPPPGMNMPPQQSGGSFPPPPGSGVGMHPDRAKMIGGNSR